MFQFRRFPSHTYLIQYGIPFGGFPHSEISGSMLICSSPKLIAAYHVLHRLLMPRHSPCALISLTVKAFAFSVNLIDSPIGSLYSWIMQAHVSRSFLAKNCIFTHLSFEIETEKKFPLLLPSHNCINNSQCSVFKVHLWVSLKKLNETSVLTAVSVNFLSSLLCGGD